MEAIRDNNRVTVGLAVSSTDDTVTLPLKVDSATGRLLTNSASGSGDVVGPASATNNAVVRFDTTTGKLIQDSSVTIADTTGDMAGVGALTADGVITLGAAALIYPASDGSDGQVLTTDGAGNIGFETPAGSGDVSKVGTPVDSQIGVWTGDGTIEGTSGLTYDGSNLQLTGDIGATGTRITKGWFTDLQVTNAIAGAITGNAATATALATARTIGGTSFDGTANIAIGALNSTNVAATTSLELKGVISDETGSGALVFATSPTLVTPALGTPASGVMTNVTGTAGGLTAGNVTTNANLTGHITSTGNAAVLGSFSTAQLLAAVTGETGTGAVVFGTSPTLVTPALGTPASGDLTNCTASSVTQKGPVELATTAEIDTGTDSTRAMPVDQFVASKRNVRWLVFNVVDRLTDCSVLANVGGDFVSPIAGTILQSDTTPFYIYATNSTAGVTGTMVVDVHLNGTTIMTTNKLDFDTTEKTTTTAATPPDLTTTALAVGDIITIDIDSIHTTAAEGLTVYMAVRET